MPGEGPLDVPVLGQAQVRGAHVALAGDAEANARRAGAAEDGAAVSRTNNGSSAGTRTATGRGNACFRSLTEEPLALSKNYSQDKQK